MNRTLLICATFGLVLAARSARADHNPNSWLLEQVIHGEFDGYEGSPGNTITSVDVQDSGGTLELSACCGDNDCSGSNTYRITWSVGSDPAVISRGQTFDVALTNELLSEGCPGANINPYVTVCGQDGSPASQVTEQGITIAPGNALTDANCDRFYTDPNESSFHVPSPHHVTVYDQGNMPHDGYWWLSIQQRWGLQYEVVWIYRENTGKGGTGGTGGGGTGGSPDGTDNDTSCTFASSPTPLNGIAMLAMFAAAGVLVRRRRARR